MKRIFKKKIFWSILVLIIIVLAGVYYTLSKDKTGSIYTTQKVRRANLLQTVSATGKVKSAEKINLSFEINGRLSQINVKTGDQVKTSQVLATLQAGDLSSRVTKAQAALTEAQARLEKALAGATPEDIEVYRAAVEKAQTDLDNAKVDLEDTKLTYSQEIDNAKEDAITECEKAITKAEISLNTGNDILTNDDYDSYLSVEDSTYLYSATDNYSIALSKVNLSRDSNSQAKVDYDDEEVNQAILDTLDALDAVALYLSDVSGVLSNSITGGALTQTKLDSLKTDINTERTTTDSSKASVLSSKQTLADARLNYQTKVNDAQTSVNTYQDVLAKAQAELDLKLAPTRSEDINLYRAQVRQAEADLLIAQQNLAKTVLKAPTDGIITDVKNEVGERISGIDTVITMLATGPFEIEVNIPESDIAKIHLTDKSEITLDAFTDEIKFLGTVVMINPAQTEIQDVIYYKVTINLDENQPEGVTSYMEQIKPGMTANIDILTAVKENVLIIPQRAVRERDGVKFVQVLEDGQVKDLEVSLGLRGDEGMIEVISGLEEGDEVITFIKEKK